ncbi:MAG: Rrf2 family transcriptional regulator [Solirubrobacterales bacterium]
MMFSTRAEYGVRVMIALARKRGSGPVPLAEVAEAENLPLSYLEQLVAKLRKQELVHATRGAHGGYELTRDPSTITMAEVVQALEGSLIPMQCFSEPGSGRVLCNHEIDGFENCATKLLWTRVQGGVARALEQTTLAELAEFAEHGPQHAQPARRRNRGGAKPSGRTAVGT